MDAAAYILALLAIITGLAISDLVVSLHGLLLNRRNVQWDWLALVAAAFIFLQIVVSWGISYRAYDGVPEGPWVWEMVLTLCQTIGLYLAARAALPDHVQPGQQVDLAAHYAFVSRYFWASLLVTHVLYLMFAIVFGNPLAHLAAYAPAIVISSAIIALVIFPSRKFHRLVVPALFALLCAAALPKRLLVG